MEVSDLNEILSVRTIKMENCENAFEEPHESVEMSDPLSAIPQYVTESDLGIIQSNSEILHAPLTVFSEAVEDEDTMQSNESGSDEVIVQLMDIRTRLSKLKSMLERKLGLDLSDYTFWLQDAKLLESHKTLVEQCVRGAGVVQVNLQIKPAVKKINILDVLKPDDEVIAKEEALNHKYSSDKEDPPLANLSSPSPHAAAVRWVVDSTFRADRRARIPDDPNDWSVQHTRLWIQWAVRQFNARGVRLADWALSGKQLCSLTSQQFKEKVPSDPGDLLWTHFELLRKCKFIAVIQNEDKPKNSEDSENKSPQSAIRKKAKMVSWEPSVSPVANPTYTIRTGHNGQTQLWQFLLELLTSAKHYDVIRWHGTEGEFKLLEPEKVARLWGARKHKPAMNYEKLSRALRYYYDGDMIAKVTGKRFVYKFVCDLRQLIGYSPSELAALVKEVHVNGIIVDDCE